MIKHFKRARDNHLVAVCGETWDVQAFEMQFLWRFENIATHESVNPKWIYGPGKGVVEAWSNPPRLRSVQSQSKFHVSGLTGVMDSGSHVLRLPTETERCGLQPNVEQPPQTIGFIWRLKELPHMSALYTFICYRTTQPVQMEAIWFDFTFLSIHQCSISKREK